MLNVPVPTTRKEKMDMIHTLKEKLLCRYESDIVAIGLYGSIALKSEGPYSDIEMYVVIKEDAQISRYEFVYEQFKIELDVLTKSELMKRASNTDDSWPICAGAYQTILSIYDPKQIFEEIKRIPLQISDHAFKETMAKIRNNHLAQNFTYMPLGAKDLTWQTAKLIGLANRSYYSTRARTYEESLEMASKPNGYSELVELVMEGRLSDRDQVYQLCEKLWSGLNEWMKELGIEYRVKNLPF